MTGPRILIIGGPRTGKTTLSRVLASKLGLDHHAIRHSDDLVGVLEWSEASEEIARWIAEPGPLICEGVAVVRGLRKALLAASATKPAEQIIYLTEPWETLTPGQQAMTKGHRTIWEGIHEQVRALGCNIAIGRAPPL